MIARPPKVLQDPAFGSLRCTYASDVSSWLQHFGLTSDPGPIGELWERELTLELLGREEVFTLSLQTADWADVLKGTHVEGQVSEAQRAAFRALTERWSDLQPQLEAALLAHYRECLEDIDYGHDRFQPVSSARELLPLCRAWRVEVKRQQEPKRRVSLRCDCDWEEGHGFSVTIQNGVVAQGE